MSNKIQYRYCESSRPQLKSRTGSGADSGLPTIVGYAAVFYNPSDPGSQFELAPGVFERIQPGAFDRAIREDDVAGLFNHDDSLMLGRTSSATMRLSVDAHGLRYEIDPPDTATANEVVELLRRGDLRGSSFSFIIDQGGSRIFSEGDVQVKLLTSVQLFDVGPVSFPAYSGTDAEVLGDQPDRARADRDLITIQLASMSFDMVAGDDGKSKRDGTGKVLDNAPDIRQQFDWDCGSTATAIVCGMFGVGPDSNNLAAYRTAVGTTKQNGTDPKGVVNYLSSLGLFVAAKNDLSITDLADQINAGNPVICCIQDWEDSPVEIPEEQAGHWVVVIGCDDKNVTLQDPWAGRLDMPTKDFLSRWEDKDSIGEFVHYGIAVSKTQIQAKQSNSKKPGRPGARAIDDAAAIHSLVNFDEPIETRRARAKSRSTVRPTGNRTHVNFLMDGEERQCDPGWGDD